MNERSSSTYGTQDWTKKINRRPLDEQRRKFNNKSNASIFNSRLNLCRDSVTETATKEPSPTQKSMVKMERMTGRRLKAEKMEKTKKEMLISLAPASTL
ncbi:MAG: hypothetical protein LQ347_001424 [Umbilicaria vellea]|nr:MAG: hypothetical protein LQ347_001424 [Umbilicaria vellea]